ncbi:helix-turn-helix transcriptional regulator [bacterium SCSIO 12643]|nr:helix-turn-helix transcriptional regulator [bacterium SCSIO 12643]
MTNRKSIVLPNATDSEISLVFYEADMDTIKSKINFTQNVFSFLISGQKEIYNAQNPNYLSGNEFALITTPNCLMTEKKSAPSRLYKSILLFFSHSILNEFKFTHQHLIQKLASSNTQEVLTFTYDDYSHYFRSSLQLLLANRETLSPEMLKAKFTEIMLYLLKYEPLKMGMLLQNQQHDREFVFKTTIENNLYSHLDLEELAFLCNMSLSTFKRHFKSYYQMSPRKYFIQKRMEMAEYLLKNGERPKEVFQQAGYKTLSNFIKAYKAHFNKTPGI